MHPRPRDLGQNAFIGGPVGHSAARHSQSSEASARVPPPPLRLSAVLCMCMYGGCFITILYHLKPILHQRRPCSDATPSARSPIAPLRDPDPMRAISRARTSMDLAPSSKLLMPLPRIRSFDAPSTRDHINDSVPQTRTAIGAHQSLVPNWATQDPLRCKKKKKKALADASMLLRQVRAAPLLGTRAALNRVWHPVAAVAPSPSSSCPSAGSWKIRFFFQPAHLTSRRRL